MLAREPTPVYMNRLQCVECGRVSDDDERGWMARLTVDDEGLGLLPGVRWGVNLHDEGD